MSCALFIIKVRLLALKIKILFRDLFKLKAENYTKRCVEEYLVRAGTAYRVDLPNFRCAYVKSRRKISSTVEINKEGKLDRLQYLLMKICSIN